MPICVEVTSVPVAATTPAMAPGDEPKGIPCVRTKARSALSAVTRQLDVREPPVEVGSHALPLARPITYPKCEPWIEQG